MSRPRSNSEPTTVSPSAPAPSPGAQPSSSENVFANLGIVVLAGGKSTRMGADKAQVTVDGRRLIDRLWESLPDHCPRVAVAPQKLGVPTVSENPPFGGPVAGIAAGLRELDTEWVAVLAVDAPGSAALLPQLAATIGGADCAVVVNAEGFDEPLCALWRRASLLTAIAQTGERDVPAGALLRAARQVVRVPGTGAERDFDTPAQLSQLGDVELGDVELCDGAEVGDVGLG
ncbi:MAG: molybdenum cofactor guanylyltransferase [Corynebacterium urealyticum]|uniref:Molybdenum cofactor guanylyltransferase n=1 Tax=Corynebacterium urealyticum TaxID=43771 RepID=A0A2W5AS26_9CORY|nr:MAG: molybdenum cofactor guanylyltransferase [Corynebacterium urealyticum]